MVKIMTKYFTKEQVMTAMGEQNLMLDDIWGVEQRLDELPVADVVEVVRCKDCKKLYPDDTGKLHWCDCHRMFVGLGDFCNYGKLKDGGENK